MARARTARLPRGQLLKTVGIIVGAALVVGLAVVATGYDAQEVPRLETSVWVTRGAGQYARVNTQLAEIDTVRSIQDPTDVVQAGSKSFVFSQGFSRLWPVDAANPVDLVEGGVAADGSGTPATSSNTPAGTREVISAGHFILYLTDTGSVFLGALDNSGADPSLAIPVNPFADVKVAKGVEPPTYSASAVAISDDGQVVMYSAAEKAVRRFDANTLKFQGSKTDVASAPDAGTGLQLAIVGSKWLLSSPTDGKAWLEGHSGPISTGLGGDTLVQSSSSTGKDAYLIDSTALIRIDTSSGAVSQVVKGSGAPAAPVVINGVTYAAWLDSSAGTLWSSDRDSTIPLKVESDSVDKTQALTPVFRTNGQRAVLNETVSGMLWTVPDGTLIPTDQWTVGDDTQENTGTVQVDDIAEEKPPVAVADSFGVRPGAQVPLSLLLNDHDPNKKDVLSIAPDSITAGLSDPSFGDLGLASDNQEAVIRVRAQSGSATFLYSATDGSAESPPVPVTLTVVPDNQNSAPVWCGVDACKQEWPSPQIVPGGTVTVPVLAGWVDPEGDPFVLSDARAQNDSDPVTVVATNDGKVAIRHNDPNASGSAIPIVVTVTDSRGASAEKVLTLLVSSSPPLVAAPIVVVAGVGEKETIAIADHVTGGSGAYRVLDAVESGSSGSGLTVVPNPAAGSIELTASTPGEYLVNYSVQDDATLAQQSAFIRVTVPEAGVPLSVAPLTAFVRANVDTTVDVIGAVQNATGRVLIVSQATTADAALSVSIIGQSQVRVSGSTPNGEAGTVGTASITITDGAGSTVEGQLTVFLVPDSTDTAPIAVPDGATVRAGALVDIPVLANDLSARGERVVLHPQVQGSGTPGELAFAAGDVVRYLAPSVPGVYTLHYTIYLESRPDRLDTTTITVTVLPSGANRAPQPSILTARALSGQTVRIPVDGYGTDPDGDAVALTAVDQPDAGKGVASITGEGDTILYSAPAGGVPGGQVSFAYSVRDSEGAEAQGLVRVGVLDGALADSTPITYSDYVRTQVGSTTPVTVQPMLDDRDPAQGTLKLISLVPNAPVGTAEYDRLNALIDPKTSLAKGTVVLAAGDVLGTHSYVYTVQSSVSTSTAEGLVVLNVSDAPAPDYPVITDTVVTASNRKQLAKGLDVVTGKVQWAAGDVSSLKLAIWGGASGFTTNGSSIVGDLPKDGALVPFSLTGKDAAGAPVVSYGFLRVPAFEDMRVQLRSGIKPLQVNEEKSVDFTLRDLLDLDPADRISIRDDDAFAVQRANASCSPKGATGATYNTGREAPWVDTCTIPVRLDGQRGWTMVAVPIDILPKDPQAILNSVTRTVAPGASESVNIYDNMTTWEGGRVGDESKLIFSTSTSGSAFMIKQAGQIVSIDTRADAAPGTRQTITVTSPAYGGLTANITLIVGVAPPDAPRGANFSHQCDVSKGACAITTVGLAGEYDPFAGKVGSGLRLVSVGTGAPVSCAVASVSVLSTSQVVANWPSGPKPVGGECTVPYTVQDAQGRTGPGVLSLDVLGYPQTPASVTTASYTGSSVTLNVALGNALQAHPTVSGVSIWEDGSAVSASCAPAGPGAYHCTVGGLVNGVKHTYTARAVNSVGDSLDTTPLTTWAYQAPAISSLTATPIYVGGTTTRDTGVVKLSVGSGDDALSFKLIGNGSPSTFPRSGTVTDQNVTLAPGSQVLQVVPVSRFQPPLSGSNEGSAQSVTVGVAGTGYYPGGGSVSSPSTTTRTLSVPALNMNGSALPKSELFIMVEVNPGQTQAGISCSTTNGTDIHYSGPGTTSSSPTFTVADDKFYVLAACGSNGYGVARSDEIAMNTVQAPGSPGGSYTYLVALDPVKSNGDATYTWSTVTPPAVDGPPAGKKLDFRFDGSSVGQSFQLRDDNYPDSLTVRYCSTFISSLCGPEQALTFDPAGIVSTFHIDFPTTCHLNPQPGDVGVSGAANAYASVAASQTLTDDSYTVTFSGGYSALAPLTYTCPITP